MSSHLTPTGASVLAFVVAIAAFAIGCGSPTTTPAPTTPPLPTDPPIVLTAPAEVEGGATFKVGWTGTETKGDFFVIVPAGATSWTETPDSPYVNATVGNPATLTAPTAAGAYEVWFMKGDLGTVQVVKARSPIDVR